MPNPSRWRSISVVLSLIIPAVPLLAPIPASARAAETVAVLDAMETGTVPNSAVDALLAKAGSGDTEAAEVAGRLYDRGVGVRWDPPTALRWYTAAALGGSATAASDAQRLWRGMPPVSQRRAEALLAQVFTDAELVSVGVGPVRRPATRRSWMTHLEAAGIPSPPPPASQAAPPALPVSLPLSLPAVPAASLASPAAPAPASPPAVAAGPQIPRPATKPALAGVGKVSASVSAKPPIPALKPKP
ncbi:sel1 repeat family protein [Skermanella pratensis]|uniref:sel1 repeat family protein n=1 Tax=Skermanella pratensis TaxID=2233999 RepID=UPI001300E443|nr:sel1 repeat family protein [Skermanella pratensis]